MSFMEVVWLVDLCRPAHPIILQQLLGRLRADDDDRVARATLHAGHRPGPTPHWAQAPPAWGVRGEIAEQPLGRHRATLGVGDARVRLDTKAKPDVPTAPRVKPGPPHELAVGQQRGDALGGVGVAALLQHRP